MKKVFLFISALFIGLVTGLLIAVRLDLFPIAQSDVPKVQDTGAVLPATGLENSVVNVAKKVGSAVVSISAEHVTRVRETGRLEFHTPFGGASPFEDDEYFRKFFDDFFGSMPDREYKQMGLGSGVIIDEEGSILTNEHVISDADKITVTLPDGREFPAEVKGKDTRSDLAIIKIKAKNLPVASLGDSDNLKIGEWVVAIGNPFGFALEDAEPTVTVGVVGALHRSLGRGITLGRNRDYSNLIQTDAAINPGNSGGPLVNLKGEIIGINVAIFSTSGGYQGIGFAIPINSAKKIISQLIEGKKILYGWLGITVQDLTEDLANYFGRTEKSGVLVAKVIKDGPADKAGIKESDIITQLDNQPLKNVRELLNTVSCAFIGKKIKLTVIRDKKPFTFEVIVGARPEDLDNLTEEGQVVTPDVWRGLEVVDLTSENIKDLNIEEKNGVLVTSVEPGSPAGNSGLRPGDVIVEINRQPVKGLTDYKKITKDIKIEALIRTHRGYFLIKGE